MYQKCIQNKKARSFSVRRGLGCPQKQSPVLSVSEMYMETLLVRSIPIAEGLKTGQKYTCKPSTEGSSRLLSRWDSEQLDWCPDGTPVHITSTSEKPNTSSENKFQTIAQKKRTTPSALSSSLHSLLFFGQSLCRSFSSFSHSRISNI